MSVSNLRSLYQQTILEHCKKPRHRGRTNPVHRYQRRHIPSCGDTVELTIKLNETRDRIEDIKFEGKSCAITMAAADLMAGALRGQTVDAALEMVQLFQSMMKGQAEFPEELWKLNVLQGVSQFPMRVKCATLPWHTLKAALKSSGGAQPAECVIDE